MGPLRVRWLKRIGVGMALAACLWGAGLVAYRWVAPFPYRALIMRQARVAGVDPYWVAGVIRVESGFRPQAVSRRGAVGLMQIMPTTARWIVAQGVAVATADPVRRLTDPAVNVRLGSWYLAYLLRRYHGSRFLALAAYNAGPETVTGWLASGRLDLSTRNPDRIPYPETRRFVRAVTVYTGLYRLLYALPVAGMLGAGAPHTGGGG